MRRTPTVLVTLLAGVTFATAQPAGAATHTGVRVSVDEHGVPSLDALVVKADGTIVSSTTVPGALPAGESFQPTDLRGTTLVGVSTPEIADLMRIEVVDYATGFRKVVAANGFSPVLTKDGKRVYFTHEASSQKPGKQKVLSVGITGGTVTTVLAPPAGRNFGVLGMSKDGKKLYACAETPLQGGSEADFARLKAPEILVGDLVTGKTKVITTKTPLAGVGCASISVSPGGTKLAVGLNITQGDDPTLSLIDLKTHKVTRLGKAGAQRLVTAWTSDGSKVVAQPARTGGPVLITTKTNHKGPEVGPEGSTILLSR